MLLFRNHFFRCFVIELHQVLEKIENISRKRPRRSVAMCCAGASCSCFCDALAGEDHNNNPELQVDHLRKSPALPLLLHPPPSHPPKFPFSIPPAIIVATRAAGKQHHRVEQHARRSVAAEGSRRVMAGAASAVLWVRNGLLIFCRNTVHSVFF